MPRIRTIKPEFPQSESIGRLSRDARLLFIQLWTICDDSGKARASSRLLASLLYPYDDDAIAQIDGWMSELHAAGMVDVYVIEDAQYLQVCNWLKHQKIDKPSPSKLPTFDEASRGLASAPRSLVGGPGSGPGPRTRTRKGTGTGRGTGGGRVRVAPPAADAAAVAVAPAPPPTAPPKAERPRYDAGPFCVFDWQHRDYQDRLAIGHREDFDLDAWYRQVACELEARGESLPPRTVHAYLSRRLYADAGLPQPSLTGRSRTHPARASPEDQAAKAARQAERDAAQTERETALAARLDALAPDERTALEQTAREALREHAPYLAPTPADIRRAMLLALARRYRGQPVPGPVSAAAARAEEG